MRAQDARMMLSRNSLLAQVAYSLGPNFQRIKAGDGVKKTFFCGHAPNDGNVGAGDSSDANGSGSTFAASM